MEREVKIDRRTADLLQIQEVVEFFAGFAWSSLGAEAVRTRRAVVRDEPGFEEEWRPIREMWSLFGEGDSPPLEGLFDPSALLDRIRVPGGSLDPGEFLRLAKFISLAPRAQGFARDRREATPWLAARCGRIHSIPEAAREIHRIVDDEARVRDNASPRLSGIRADLRRMGDRIQREVQRLMRESGAAGHLSDSFFTVRDGRYCLPVLAGRRRSVPGIVHGSSATGETLFIEPAAVVELTNEQSALQSAEEDEVRRILAALADSLRPHEPALRENVDLYREIDDAATRARAGWEHGLKLPRLVEQPPVRWDEPDESERGRRPGVAANARGAYQLVAGHHPLLRLGLAETEESVPIDVPLRAGDRVLVLSGPNAGGKTTTLKMAGLLCWMTQAGFPVPVGADTTLPIVSHIGAVIGDQQDILAGDSTFSAHLKRLRDLHRAAGPGSLLLLDEVAAGTDPSEGAPLAIALLEALAERGAQVIITSHLGPLKEWANSYRAARNASFALRPEDHTPTFTLSLDVPGASEALVVAEKIGMDRTVVERARVLIPEERRRAQELLRTLREKQMETDRLAADQARRETELEEKMRRLEEREAALRADRQTYRERMLQEKLRDLREVRAEIERQVAALPPREALQAARDKTAEELRRTERELDQTQRESAGERAAAAGLPKPEELQPGQHIYVPSLRAEGEVVRVEPERGLVRLLVSGIEMEMGLGQLTAAELPSGLAESELKPFRLEEKLKKRTREEPEDTEESGSASETRPPLNPDLSRALEGVMQRVPGRGLFRKRNEEAGRREEAEKPMPAARTKKAKTARRRKKREWSDEDFAPLTTWSERPARKSKPVARPEETEEGENSVVAYTLRRAQAAPELTLDLHGMRVDEALEAVDRHIDGALLSDYPFVRLMHGFGTGALRNAIHQHLRGHPYIRRLSIAPTDEGGGGVTIVEFK